MSSRRKILVGIVLAAVLGAAGVLSTRSRSGRGVEVRMEEVTHRDLISTVTASGNIRARRKVDISSDVSARVTQLLVDEGDDVESGEILLRLDPTRLQASVDRNEGALSQARAQVSQQQANLVKARREHERMIGLRSRDSLLVSQQDVENAETDLEVARSLLEAADHGVSQADAALAEAKDQLAKTIIRAPISGKITRLNVELGETVIVGTMNNAGSLILTISDLDVVEVVLEVDETDVPDITLGDSALVDLDAYPDVKFIGTVTEIGNSAIRPPASTAGTGQTPTIDFEVVVTLHDPPERLRPDLSATADVITERRSGVLSIPIIALTVREWDPSANATDEGVPERAEGPVARGRESQPEEGVFVVAGGQVEFRAVVVGIAGQEYFEVASGLSEGEVVVSGPYQTIRSLTEGDEVRRIEANEPGA